MREIILIKTSEAEKIKSLLKEKEINYSVIYDDILYDKRGNLTPRYSFNLTNIIQYMPLKCDDEVNFSTNELDKLDDL